VSLLGMDERILERNGVKPEQVAGFISLDGIFDLAASLPYLKSDQVETLRTLFGPSDASLAAHSTISYARADHPPLLFLDSSGDEAVCLDGFRSMKTRMTEVGGKAQFIELPGLGHNETAIQIGMDEDVVMPHLLDFIRRAGPAGGAK
jgi:hypothetical protein